MNKDVIYIEPEDDITDIITKIENAKEKIVALVPPKKAGVFRSIVNIKLIAKAGFTADKTIVLVTTDPSITKLAAATKIPVTKNLQSAPTIPTLVDESEPETTSKEEIVEEDGEVKAEEVSEEKADSKEAADDADEESDEDAGEKDDVEDKKEDKADKKKSKKEKIAEAKKKSKEAAKNAKKFSAAWFKAHKGLTIGFSLGGILVIAFLVWAFAIAPAVTVTVSIRTATQNFSKNATFTTKLEEENADEGKFFLTEKKIENESSVEFEATGKKNIGAKATGNVVIYAYFSRQGTVVVNAGDTFSINDLTFVANDTASLTWDGTFASCEDPTPKKLGEPCKLSGRVNVTAAEPGEKYNIAASSANWKTNVNVSVYSDSAMAGGTDQLITVVSQADIDAAKEKLGTSSEAENKQKLLDTLDDGAFVIDSSFKQTTGDVTSTPAVGEEVKEGVKPKISVKVSDSIFLIDKTKVEEFITKEAKLAENYKIYKMDDPFVESFAQTEGGYTGRIKTSYTSGPKVTENDIIEIIKGKGIGDAKHDLASIDGINGSSIRIDPSYPWVMSVPGDTNKITVIIDVKDGE